MRRNINEPVEVLKQALLLLKDITPVTRIIRQLEPVDITDIKRNIDQLKKVKSEPAKRLLSIFEFKYRSIEEFSKNHPATVALSDTTKHVPAPATILLISQLNHDAESIRIMSEKLSRRRYTTLPIDVPVVATPR